jgi:60 kDa SS-A/Ro ribonucleoprotein
MVDVLRSVSTRKTPQSEPAGAATVKNAAGGYVFGIDDFARLRRFLVLGTEGGTYYTKPAELTRQNANVVLKLAETEPLKLVNTIVEISLAGRAPRQNPAIFALAVAASSSNDAGRAYALSKLPAVCRTGTHMYLFAGYVEQFRGWGRGLKRAIGEWYNGRELDKLAYQTLKYRQREGWRHADLLALSHPEPDVAIRDNLYRYIVDTMTNRGEDRASIARHRNDYKMWEDAGTLPELVGAFEEVQGNPSAAVRLIDQYALSWEMLPDEALAVPTTWEALVEKGMPQTALMKQLPRLTRLGLCDGRLGTKIAKQLSDTELLKRGRVHPINVLVAQRTYASGQSARGDGTWTPSRKITDALDAAFYNAYGAVQASGKRILLACDVSGSMSAAASGLPLSCREAVAALSLVSLNVEQDCEVIGFSDGTTGRFGWGREGAATRLDISPRRRLDDVCRYMESLAFGRTDCALPMIWATQQRENFDAIWVLTDNETWFGKIHPWQALKAYREQYGPTQFGVIAMTATGQSIADPADPTQLDISGFDSNVPQVISSFSAGLI